MRKLKKIISLGKKISELRSQRDQLILVLQDGCNHDNIIETIYESTDFFSMSSGLPPYRVCRDCGRAEEGWGCGYLKLQSNSEIPKISRREANKYILKFYSQKDMW